MRKIIVFSLILLALTFFAAMPAPRVSAEVTIDPLSPSEGNVGTVVSVTGQISTENGSYRIFFGNEEMPQGNATLYDVSDTFVVPNSTSGDNLVKLQDVSTGENSTTRKFTVKPSYKIQAITPPSPKQLQQGVDVTVLATFTGGNQTIFANVTVKDPASVERSSNTSITVSPTIPGYGEANLTYPTDFYGDPDTPAPSYVGTYDLSLDRSNETLQSGTFTVGLTDATEYHRFQTVYIQAANYTPADVLTTTITYGNTTFELDTTAPTGPRGIVTANWTIPANASMRSYRVDMTPKPPAVQKQPPDIQNFTIVSESFACEVKTVNLDNEPVEGVSIDANNTITKEISRNSTNKEGFASFYLEAANYTFTALWNVSEQSYPAQVGEKSDIRLCENLTRARNSSITIVCSLAHINVAVKDTEGIAIPFVDVRLDFAYIPRVAGIDADAINASLSSETNITGLTTFLNVFANVNYTIQASRYDHAFYTTTINLTSTTWLNVTSPTHKLIINVYDLNKSPLQNAKVKVYEWSTGANATDGSYVQQGVTNENGKVEFNFTFGKYGVLVYISRERDILLNQTAVNLINASTIFNVYCTLYPLTLNVSVLDWFGQGIPNANVTIEQEGVHESENTGGNGVAHFQELVGGNYKIFVYIGERQYKSAILNLQEHKTVTLKIGEIVSIGGIMTETSHFLTVIFILFLLAVLLFTFIYSRIKSSRKTE